MIVESHLRSWVDTAPESPFPIQNLPYGVFTDQAGTRCGVAIGDRVLDLAGAESAGLFTNTGLEKDTFRSDSLNRFLEHSRGVWSTVRARIVEVLNKADVAGRRFCETNDLLVDGPVRMRRPIDVGDLVAFSSSEQHAANVGRLFRPGDAPLAPNWKHLPIAYHGRAGTVIASGTEVRRPHGQRPGPDGPTFGPSTKLDFELEVGFVTGHGPDAGNPVSVDDAEHHIFGLCLVNDWSARDLRAWEGAPLGPFLSNSFATTISSWIVPLEALEPFRVPAPVQDPAPLPYLVETDRKGLALDLVVTLTPDGGDPAEVCATSFAGMYWTMAQQLAHATVNGATFRAGDLFASGTVSGSTSHEFGSLLERTSNGSEPIDLGDGRTRTFLEDGDTVTISGECSGPGTVRVGFGTCVGTVRA